MTVCRCFSCSLCVFVAVLCPLCAVWVTKEYKIKNGAIFHKCYACGAKEMVDMSHKLCTYIVNTAKKAKKGKDKEKDSKEKKREKKVRCVAWAGTRGLPHRFDPVLLVLVFGGAAFTGIALRVCAPVVGIQIPMLL